jgi:two-component system sensor histidine kinase RegB
MWVNFGFSALLIAWFVVRMAGTLREQARDISDSREAGLRNEQIISVASIAAGTAHEMRTPLATMAITVDEIGHEHPELTEDLAVLEQQIKRCDSILRELVSTSSEGSRMIVTAAGKLLKNLQDKWSLVRPEVKLDVRIPGKVSKLEIRYDQSLQHALMSFLNNAADASPDFVSLRAESAPGAILFIIEDHGPGIPREIADRLGKAFINRKEGGLGLGVLLSQASVERLGGTVTLTGLSGRGTRLEIRFPLYETTGNE